METATLTKRRVPQGDQTAADRSVSGAASSIMDIMHREGRRQDECIEMIASENIVSASVRLAQGSVLTNKYAEGYPGRRYYGGCSIVDEAELIAIDRAKNLFDCRFANVQPHSGSQANQAVFLALLQPGDMILGMDLSAGGHLTHGSPVNLSGRWFKTSAYGVDPETHRIDMEQVERLAMLHRPKLIVAGGSAYSRWIDFARFRQVADRIGAYLMVDMAHVAGLVAGGAHPSPIPHAHVVTSTTHKTLRGPRGGLLLCDDPVIAKKLDSAIFPGLQGGPLMHVVAAKAIAFGEASTPEFRGYARAVTSNAAVLAQALADDGFDLVTGGTDNHLVLVDLRSKGLTGAAFEAALGQVGITCNKNSVPGDTQKATITSGVRFGTPATTTRGFGASDYVALARIVADLAHAFDPDTGVTPPEAATELRARVRVLTARHPLAQ